MNIGQLTQNTAGIYMGKIQTAALDLTVGLRPVNSTNAAAPKFDVMVRAKNGQFIAAGGLWEKTATNGAGNFLQGQIDDPSFDAPLSIALFSQEDGSLNVAWSRPRRRSDSPFGGSTTMGAANDSFTARDEGSAAEASPFASVEPGFAAAA
jgi:uncharacterized protein (DUF736 family)